MKSEVKHEYQIKRNSSLSFHLRIGEIVLSQLILIACSVRNFSKVAFKEISKFFMLSLRPGLESCGFGCGFPLLSNWSIQHL